MIQWITFAFTLLGLAYNGYRHSQFPVQNIQGVVQNAPTNTPIYNPAPVMYWQVAFDPNTGRLYHLHSDGRWYDQPPMIQVQQQTQQVQQNNNPWFR